MAGLARRAGIEVEVAAFEAWDPAGRAFDAVIAAQAWHWVDPVAGTIKAARVLRPGGRLAAFWNAFQPPPGLVDAFAAVYRRVQPGLPVNPWAWAAPDGYLAMCATAASGIRQAGAFGQPEQWRFDWDRPYTRGEWLELVRHRRRGRQLHDALRHDRGHRSAHRHPLTRLHALVRCQRHAPGQATTPDRSPPAARPRMPRPNAC
jgi:SAM-dependent methyltransferase